MKKLIALILICTMMLITLVGCFGPSKITGRTTAEKTEKIADVTLLGATMKEHKTETMAMTAFVPRLLAAPDAVGETTAAETEAVTTASTIVETTEVPDDGDDYISYIVIYRTQELVDFTINLDNSDPHKYHIHDIELSSDDENVEIEIFNSRTGESEFVPLNECGPIDWVGTSMKKATYTLKLSNTEKTDPTKIRIDNIFYSNRETGVNDLRVNLNDRENYDIYRTDAEIKFLRRQNSNNFFEFDLEKTDVDTITVKVNGEEVLPEPSTESEAYSTYRLPFEGELTISYTSEVEAGKVYHNIYKETIQFLKFERTYAGGCVTGVDAAFIYCKISGTDFEYKNITVKDQVIGYPGFAKIETDSWGQYIFINVETHNLVLIICGTEFSRSFFDSLPAPQQ